VFIRLSVNVLIESLPSIMSEYNYEWMKSWKWFRRKGSLPIRSTLLPFAWRDRLKPRKPQSGQAMSRPRFVTRSFRYFSGASPLLQVVRSFASLVVTVRIAMGSLFQIYQSRCHYQVAGTVKLQRKHLKTCTLHWRDCFRARYVTNIFNMKT
jgi:hypothetical protein